MDEVLRVLRMLEAGKINREEAERLLAALGVGSASGERVRRWLRVEGPAADIQVLPTRDGDVAASGYGAGELFLETDDEGGLLRVRPRGLRRFKVELFLPPDWGIDLALGKGTLKASSLSGLKGDLGVGKVEVAGVRELDFSLGAGEASIGLLLKEGEHRLVLGAGKAKIYALPGASFRVQDGRVYGEGRARGPGDG